jgi:hypothetical protein
MSRIRALNVTNPICRPLSQPQVTYRSAQRVADDPLVFGLEVDEAGLDDVRDRIDQGPEPLILFLCQRVAARSRAAEPVTANALSTRPSVRMRWRAR